MNPESPTLPGITINLEAEGELKGKFAALEVNAGQIFGEIQTLEGIRKLSLSEIIALNPDLPAYLQNLRIRLEALLEMENQEKFKILLGTEVRTDQEGSLQENVTIYEVVDSEGQILGQAAASTSPAGYMFLDFEHDKWGVNEDGYLLAIIEGGICISIADGIGGAKNSQAWTQNLLEFQAEDPSNPHHAGDRTKKILAGQKGGVCFTSAKILKGKPLEETRMGDCETRAYRGGELIYYSGLQVKMERWDPATNEYLPNQEPIAHSKIEQLNLGAEELRTSYLVELAEIIQLQFKQFDQDQAKLIAEKIVTDLYKLPFKQELDEMLDAFIEENKDVLKEVESEGWLMLRDWVLYDYLEALSYDKSEEWMSGLNQYCNRIIGQNEPYIRRESEFAKKIARKPILSLSNSKRIKIVDHHRVPTMIPEAGDLFVMYSDGLKKKLRDSEGSVQDELDAIVKEAVNRGESPQELASKIARLLDERIEQEGGDNVSFVIYQVA